VPPQWLTAEGKDASLFVRVVTISECRGAPLDGLQLFRMPISAGFVPEMLVIAWTTGVIDVSTQVASTKHSSHRDARQGPTFKQGILRRSTGKRQQLCERRFVISKYVNAFAIVFAGIDSPAIQSARLRKSAPPGKAKCVFVKTREMRCVNA